MMRGACLVYRVPGAPFNGRRGIQYKKPHILCGFLYWWSRRESNSRLTGLPKGFLHAYAAVILRHAPLRPKGPAGRNLKTAAPPTSHRHGCSPPFWRPHPPGGKEVRTNCLTV